MVSRDLLFGLLILIVLYPGLCGSLIVLALTGTRLIEHVSRWSAVGAVAAALVGCFCIAAYRPPPVNSNIFAVALVQAAVPLATTAAARRAFTRWGSSGRAAAFGLLAAVVVQFLALVVAFEFLGFHMETP